MRARDQCTIFNRDIPPWLWASIGVTCSYFSCPFLCTLGGSISAIITIFLTGTATQDTPTITPGTPPVVTTLPPSDPLGVHFANNTPRVVGNTVTVQVHTNKPASATCRLGRVATMPCKQFIQYHNNTMFLPCTRICITIHISVIHKTIRYSYSIHE